MQLIHRFNQKPLYMHIIYSIYGHMDGIIKFADTDVIAQVNIGKKYNKLGPIVRKFDSESEAWSYLNKHGVANSYKVAKVSFCCVIGDSWGDL